MVFIILNCAPRLRCYREGRIVLLSGRVINHPFIAPGRVTWPGVPFLLSQAWQLEGKGPARQGLGAPRSAKISRLVENVSCHMVVRVGGLVVWTLSPKSLTTQTRY